MFIPSYSLTQKLLTTLQEIERLYGRLEGTQVPQRLLLNLERDNMITSSFASNSMEGNPLSQAEVTNLLLNDRVPVNRDEKEIVNYFTILKKLADFTNKTFSNEVILSIHKKLLDGVRDDIKGQMRTKKIIVGSYNEQGEVIVKHDPPYHTTHGIKTALSGLHTWLEQSKDSAILKAGIYHHQFVYVHPFEDGNGRTCRLLTALILLKQNYLINKYFVLDDYYNVDRSGYSDALHSADSGDKTVWLEYFTDGIKYSLESALGKIESSLSRLPFDIRPSTREQEVLGLFQQYKQMSSADLVTELNVSRQQAFNLLSALVEKGFLVKKGSTKASYYELK